MHLFATNIFENDSGEPVIAIDALSGKPETPSLVLNTPEKAIFYRSADQYIDISNMDLAMHTKLRTAQRVLVAEVNKDGQTHGYYADVKELN